MHTVISLAKTQCLRRSVSMRVMFVRHMRVCMPRWLMPMPMAVRRRRHGSVVMRMVPVVVAVCMFVFEGLVFMLVCMALCQMDHDADRHQRRAGGHPCPGAALAEQECKQGADKGRECKDRRGARRAEGTLGEQVEAQAQSVPCGAHGHQAQGRPDVRSGLSEQECERARRDGPERSLHHDDLSRVSFGHGARQVVV